MRALRFSKAAKRGLRDIAVYIADEQGSASVARKFLAQINARCSKLARLPGLMGRARSDLPGDMRSVPHRDYVIFFRYLPDTLEVVAIIHAHRDVIAYFGDDVIEP